MAHLRRGVDTLSIARTTRGSNCVPEHFFSSRRAASRPTGLRYERAAVMTSNVSATATMRAPRQIWSALRPSG
jgi:hypothetical protein